MTWFKVDDDLAFHRKTVAAGNGAMGLWVRAGSWCSQQLSDGRIPHDIARTMGKPSEIKALVRVGLWENEEDSYRFHDFFERNPSRAEVEERRAAEAKKKSEWRAKRAGQQGLSTGDKTGDSPVSSPGESPGESDGVSRSSRPDPTRPVKEEEKTSSSLGARKRATKVPDDFTIDDGLREWAAEKGLTFDLQAETEAFIDHHRAKGSTMKDWRAAWRTWMTNAVKFGNARGGSFAIVGDRRLTGSELENLLGPDVWSPPDAPAGMGPDEAWEWQRQRRLEHIADRQQKARALMGRTA